MCDLPCVREKTLQDLRDLAKDIRAPKSARNEALTLIAKYEDYPLCEGA